MFESFIRWLKIRAVRRLINGHLEPLRSHHFFFGTDLSALAERLVDKAFQRCDDEQVYWQGAYSPLSVIAHPFTIASIGFCHGLLPVNENGCRTACAVALVKLSSSVSINQLTLQPFEVEKLEFIASILRSSLFDLEERNPGFLDQQGLF